MAGSWRWRDGPLRDDDDLGRGGAASREGVDRGEERQGHAHEGHGPARQAAPHARPCGRRRAAVPRSPPGSPGRRRAASASSGGRRLDMPNHSFSQLFPFAVGLPPRASGDRREPPVRASRRPPRSGAGARRGRSAPAGRARGRAPRATRRRRGRARGAPRTPRRRTGRRTGVSIPTRTTPRAASSAASDGSRPAKSPVNALALGEGPRLHEESRRRRLAPRGPRDGRGRAVRRAPRRPGTARPTSRAERRRSRAAPGTMWSGASAWEPTWSVVVIEERRRPVRVRRDVPRERHVARPDGEAARRAAARGR